MSQEQKELISVGSSLCLEVKDSNHFTIKAQDKQTFYTSVNNISLGHHCMSQEQKELISVGSSLCLRSQGQYPLHHQGTGQTDILHFS